MLRLVMPECSDDVFDNALGLAGAWRFGLLVYMI